MQMYRILAVVTLIALTGCAELSDEDKSMLRDTQAEAHSAKVEAAQASAAAQRAADSADKAQQSAAQSAAAAEAASQKADRIFRQSGVK